MTKWQSQVIHWFTVGVVILNGAWLLPQTHVGMEPRSLNLIMFLVAALLCAGYLLSAVRGNRRAAASLLLIGFSAVLLHYGWEWLFHEPSLIYKDVAIWAAIASPAVAVANCVAIALVGVLYFHHSERKRAPE